MAASRSGRCRRSACRPATRPGECACPSSSSRFVSLWTFVPSAFMTYSSRTPKPPSRVLSKTIRVPSGDHEGWRSSAGSGGQGHVTGAVGVDHVDVARLELRRLDVRGRTRCAIRPGTRQDATPPRPPPIGSTAPVSGSITTINPLLWVAAILPFCPGYAAKADGVAIEPAAAHRIAAVIVMMRSKRGLPVGLNGTLARVFEVVKAVAKPRSALLSGDMRRISAHLAEVRST